MSVFTVDLANPARRACPSCLAAGGQRRVTTRGQLLARVSENRGKGRLFSLVS
jgi:hypothetical protein